MALTEGQMVGPYKVISQLGFGGMATVYKAYHARLDRYVAIKIMHSAFQEDRNFLARFEREAQIVARLEHPHIIPVYDFADLQGQPYLVMKYVEGRTLKGVQANGALPLNEIIRVMTAIAGALDYAHRQGVLHRDIKPSNLIIAADGMPYITDFGLARMAQLGDSTLSHDMLLGTPHYISPEQATGSRDLSPRTDLYSLGVVLYELVVGRVPYSGDTPLAIIHSHVYSALPKPSTINPDIPPEVEAVLEKALSKDPGSRYDTATDMMNAFTAAVQASGLTELNPNRIALANAAFDQYTPISEANDSAYDQTPPEVQIPAPVNTDVRRQRLSSPQPNTNSDPDMTSAPRPLESADPSLITDDTPADSVPPVIKGKASSAVSAPSAGANKRPSTPPTVPNPPSPPNVGTAGQLIGSVANMAASAARLAAAEASKAINEAAQNMDKEAAEKSKTKAQAARAAFNRDAKAAQEAARKKGIHISIENTDDLKRLVERAKSGEFEQQIEEIFKGDDDDIPLPGDEEAIRRRVKKQIEARNGFFGHLVAFVIVNTMLYFFAADGNEGFLWSMIPLLGWGAGLIAHGVETFFTTGGRAAVRTRAVQREYYRLYGDAWVNVDKRELRKIRKRVDKPYKERVEFLSHLGVYGMINAMLWYIFLSNNEGGGGFPWPLIVTLAWGIGLVINGIEALSAGSQERGMQRAIERERALLNDPDLKRKNEQISAKRKNEERDYGFDFEDDAPEVRLTGDGEFTESMIRDLDEEVGGEKRRRSRRG